MKKETGKHDRLHEACMAILQATSKQELGMTLLNKALFYADLIALRDLGHTITGEKFLALKNGPVVASYKRRIVRDLQNARWATQVQKEGSWETPMRVETPLSSFQNLTVEEIDIATQVAHAIEGKLAWAISNLSHENAGWQSAYKGPDRPGGEINMLLALQQVAEPDPWMNEEPDTEFCEALQVGATSSGERF